MIPLSSRTSNAGQYAFHLDQFQVRINYPGGACGRNFIDAVAVYVVPELDVITVEVIQIHPVLAVLAHNQKGSMVPHMPGLFVKTEGVEGVGGS